MRTSRDERQVILLGTFQDEAQVILVKTLWDGSQTILLRTSETSVSFIVVEETALKRLEKKNKQ